MRNDSILSGAVYGKSLLGIVLCLAFLVVLKPDRLGSALDEIAGEPCAGFLVSGWTQAAKDLGFVSLSDYQHDFFAFYTTDAIIGQRPAPNLSGAGTQPGGTEAEATAHPGTTTPGGAATGISINATSSGIARSGNATAAIRAGNGTTPSNATRQVNGTALALSVQTNGTKAPVPSVALLHPVYVANALQHGEWYFSLPPLDVLLAAPKAGVLNLDWSSGIPFAGLFPFPSLPQSKSKILLTGDSMMMEGLGPALLRVLKARSDLEVRREAVYSTGLCRSDYFDWPAHMTKLVEEFTPDLVVICIGGNDAQDIVDDKKKRHFVGTDSWQTEYQARAENLAANAQSKGAKLILVGLPILGKEPQAKNTVLLTSRQKAVCTNGTSRTFVDTYTTLADGNGAYATFLKDDTGKHVRIRSKDQVHVSEAGGRILAGQVVPVIESLFPAPVQPILPVAAIPATNATGKELAKQVNGNGTAALVAGVSNGTLYYQPLKGNATLFKAGPFHLKEKADGSPFVPGVVNATEQAIQAGQKKTRDGEPLSGVEVKKMPTRTVEKNVKQPARQMHQRAQKNKNR